MVTAIQPKVKEVIVEQLGVDPEKVKSEASFIDDLGADSLDIVELVMAMEEEFDLEIPALLTTPSIFCHWLAPGPIT